VEVEKECGFAGWGSPYAKALVGQAVVAPNPSDIDALHWGTVGRDSLVAPTVD